MRRVRWGTVLAAFWVGLVTGCLSVTVHVTFPQEKLETAASSIEDLVSGGQTAPPPKPAPKRQNRRDDGRGKQSLLDAAFAVLGPSAAEAQVPELKIRTPEVMASIQSRRQRFPQVQEFKGRGCVGENTRGLLEARPGQGCGPEVAGLITAENRDRMTLYQILLKQNNMPPEDLKRIQAAFAKVFRNKAAPGEWIQAEDGRWVKK